MTTEILARAAGTVQMFSHRFPALDDCTRTAIAEAFSPALRPRVMFDNPRATCPRIAESVAA